MFVYESFARSRSRPASVDRAVVERELRAAVDRMPVRVVWKSWVDAERDEAEVCGGELPLAAGGGRGR